MRGSDLAANSVSGGKILNGSVKGSDVKDNSLTGSDIKESTLVWSDNRSATSGRGHDCVHDLLEPLGMVRDAVSDGNIYVNRANLPPLRHIAQRGCRR